MSLRSRTVLCTFLLGVGCGKTPEFNPESKSSPEDDSDSSPGNPTPGGSSDAAQPLFPRLTHAQWENTVRDLMRLPREPGLASAFGADPPIGRFDNNVMRLQVTEGLWSDYQKAAETIAERVTSNSTRLSAISSDKDSEGFITNFGRRAFRRPLIRSEVDRYVRLFATGGKHYPDMPAFDAGARLVIEAILQSPFFLYQTEVPSATQSDATAGSVRALTDYEVASRLSYAFWNTMPDDALFDAAAAGALGTSEQVRRAAMRMFNDPKSQGPFTRFHVQNFKILDYRDLEKSAELFPEWSAEIGESMQTSTELFLGDVLFRGGTVRDLLTSRTAFVDSVMANLYGVQGQFTDTFVKVTLDSEKRAGVLTRAGFLAKNATLTEPDPILRGVFVNLNLLCRDMSAVPTLPESLMPVGNTNRERVNSLTGPGTCGGDCHVKMINPIGFALENYDAIGQWRDSDNGFPVDAADTYQLADGTEISYANGIDLSEKLAEVASVHSCYIQHLLEYIYGRGLVKADGEMVSALAELSYTQNLPLGDILVEMASSDAFRFRVVGKE